MKTIDNDPAYRAQLDRLGAEAAGRDPEFAETTKLGYTVEFLPNCGGGFVFRDPNGVTPAAPGAPFATEDAALRAAAADAHIYLARPPLRDLGIKVH